MKQSATDRAKYGRFENPEPVKDGDPSNESTERPAAQSACHDDDYLHDDCESAVARRPSADTFYRNTGKPALDRLFILFTLPISVPLIALCALALRVQGCTPFYTQERLGRNGKSFAILKLRTMVQNADTVLESYLATDPERRREWDELQKLRDDPRITRLGRFLRATSLDELPQLFNVFKGDMSLVGPRPMMPDQLAQYGDPQAYFGLKPGITGLWQVAARDNTKLSHRNEVDREYERKISLSFDLALLFRTVGVVIRRTGY